MIYLLLVLVALVLVPTTSIAQEEKPTTKLEAFQAITGIVIVRSYTTVGAISGLGGIVTVDVREFRDASNPVSEQDNMASELPHPEGIKVDLPFALARSFCRWSHLWRKQEGWSRKLRCVKKP